MILTLEKFLSYFPNIELTKEEFIKKFIVTYKNNPTLEDIFNFKSVIKNNKDKRYLMKDRIIDYFYKMVISNRHEYLSNFYESYFAFFDPFTLKWDNIDIHHNTNKCKTNVNILNCMSNKNKSYEENFLDVLDDSCDKRIISLQKNDGSRRLVRNLNFLEILSTTKVTNSCKSETPLWDTLIMIYNNLTLPDRLFAPSSIDQFFVQKNKLNEFNYNAFFYLIQGYQPKASILNPYTINWIIKNLFKGEKIFTPVLSWCSYIFAFMHTNWKHYVGDDVIQEVVDRTQFVFDYYNNKEKSINLFCQPSETLLTNKDFQKYKSYFDAILLCPPYYDMEIYKSGEQSVNKWKTYSEWLTGYWEGTMKVCNYSLSPTGTFSFIINNYKSLNGIEYDLIKDLNLIASKYFKLKDIIKLHNRGSPLRVNHKDRTEMLFIYEYKN